MKDSVLSIFNKAEKCKSVQGHKSVTNLLLHYIMADLLPVTVSIYIY